MEGTNMIMKGKKHFAIPPGCTIEELLLDRNISVEEFAERMNLDTRSATDLLNGDIVLTEEIANRLESIFELPARFWIGLENLYRETIILVEKENAQSCFSLFGFFSKKRATAH